MAGNPYKKAAIMLTMLAIIVFSCRAHAAAEPEFRIDMDNLNLRTGVSANMILSIINAHGAEVVEIQGLDNFSILSQSATTSINMSGNVSNYQEDRYYILKPKEAGQFELKAIIKYNGVQYESNALLVSVGEEGQSDGDAQPDIFIKTVISKPEVFFGEKIVVTHELFTRYSIEDFGFLDYAPADGLIVKEMPEERLNAEYVYLDGVRYAKYEIKQTILDPIKTGDYAIPSYNVQVNVVTEGGGRSSRSGPGGIFGAMPGGLFSRSQPMYVQTERKDFRVMPLPKEGRPADFSGIVGELSVEGRYSRENLNYGDSLSLFITASGNCNLDGVNKIIAGGFTDFTVYETQKNAVEYVKDNKYYVQKDFEIILVPVKTGSIETAPAPISYFNPTAAKYEYADIPGAVIEVAGVAPRPDAAGGEGGGARAPFETISVRQVNYAGSEPGYITLRINKSTLYNVLIGIFILLALSASIIWAAAKLKKRDPELKSLYKRIMAADEINEAYNAFCELVKRLYGVSLKADSQAAVRNGVTLKANSPATARNVDGQPDMAVIVIEIMDYMESGGEKDCAFLKDKIREARRRSPQLRALFSIFPYGTKLRAAAIPKAIRGDR